MSRYIDADKKLTITVYDDEHEENIDRYMTIEEILDTYTSEGCPTTADVVEIVRCKYCKWHGYLTCSNPEGLKGWVMDNDFCSYVERKDNFELPNIEELIS